MDAELLQDVVVLSIPTPLMWVLLVWGVGKLIVDGLSLVHGWRTLQHEIRMEGVRAKAYAAYLREPE